MADFEQLGLFPTPVLRTTLGREFTKSELNYFSGLRAKGTTMNAGNTTSANTYLFNDAAMKKIRALAQEALDTYLQTIVKPKYESELYITQAWANFSDPGQFHHQHAHPGSFISGVFYANANRDLDKIMFTRPGHQYNQIELVTEDFNPFNSTSWWIPVGTGDLILFPSWFTHEVPRTESTETRISISFNTFIRGQIGDDRSLTGLYLK